MRIHTFEVSSTLTNEDYYNIQNNLKVKDPSKWKAVPNGMIYWGLSDKGILINMHQVKKKDFFSYKIMYRISARRVMEHDNFVELFNTNNYDELEEEVNCILKEKCSLLPKLKKCKLRRLDFCLNAKLENQDQVKAYIKTVKRANVPSKLELRKRYDKISKRKKASKDEFAVYASEYVEISIYNKYREMKNEKVGTFPASEIERAKNIVRIEIRCMEGKINALKKKYDIKTISAFMSNADKIGKELYRYYLSQMFNEGTIHNLKEALDQVEQSEYKQKNKALLKDFLKETNAERTVADAMSRYKSMYGKSELNRLIFMLDGIDTNYVTVTNADQKLFDNGYIPTPLELYKEFSK